MEVVHRDVRSPSSNRRLHRSDDTMQAMSLQLDACRDAGRLTAIFVGDEDGLCLAWSGDGETCERVAATVAPLARRMENFEGLIETDQDRVNVRMRRFEVGGTRLLIGAVGGGGEVRAAQIHRSIGGVSRILGL